MTKKYKLKREVRLGLLASGVLVGLLVLWMVINALFGQPSMPAHGAYRLVVPNEYIAHNYQAGKGEEGPKESQYTKNLAKILAKADPNAPLGFLNDLHIDNYGNTSMGNDEEIIGRFIMPAADIDLFLYGVMSDGNSAAGIVTMWEHQAMGHGNYVLTGHSAPPSWTDANKLLNKLQARAEKGMKILLTDEVKIYTYEVYDLRATDDQAFYMIEPQRAEEAGAPVVTVMTCYNGQSAEGRYFVSGKLIDTKPYSEEALNKLIAENK